MSLIIELHISEEMRFHFDQIWQMRCVSRWGGFFFKKKKSDIGLEAITPMTPPN